MNEDGRDGNLLFFFVKGEPMILTGVIWSARIVWFSLVIINIVDKDIVHINHDEENTVWLLTSKTRT